MDINHYNQLWRCWFILTRESLKKEMFELEPHELTRLLVERTATFHAMYEGVIAIDKKKELQSLMKKPSK